MFAEMVVYAFLFILTYWFYVCIRYYYISMWGMKGDIPIPLLGTVKGLKDTSSALKLFPKNHGKYGENFKLMTSVFLGVSITDRNLLEYFLSTTKQLNKGMMYVFLHGWLKTGLLTGNGAKWHQMRKILTPAFHFNILTQFISVFHSNADILVQQLSKEVGKGSTDVYNYVTLCALDIICESAMGTSIHAQIKQDNEYVNTVKIMCEIIMSRTLNPFIHLPFVYRWTKLYQKEQECLKVLHGYTHSVIVARKETLKNRKCDEEEVDSEMCTKKRSTFLDLLLESTIDGQPLSDDDIREEVDTFMFAGHDTTTSAISFCLFMVAKHPHVQNKIMEEQKVLFGDDTGKTFSINELNDMKYLEAVIKETLRLFPPIPFYARHLKGDYKYSDVVIPNFTQIMIPAFVIHRDSKNFTNPETFDPERFLYGKVPKPYTYLPFSIGPRNCIGQKFAMLEMKVVITKVLSKYELLPVVPEHTLNLVSEITLKSSNGILINIKNRS